MVFLKFVPPWNITCKWLTSCISDWHLLPCEIKSSEIVDSLPRDLQSNEYETQQLLATSWWSIDFVKCHALLEKHDWSKAKVLCKKCVLEFMGYCVLKYLRKLKAQRGNYCLCPVTCLKIT